MRIEIKQFGPPDAITLELHALLEKAKIGEVTKIPDHLAQALRQQQIEATRDEILRIRQREFRPFRNNLLA